MCTVGCMNVCACANVPVEWAYACEKSRWSSDESKATIENWANGQMTVSLMLTAAAVCVSGFLSRCGPCTVLLGKERSLCLVQKEAEVAASLSMSCMYTINRRSPDTMHDIRR